MPPSPTHPVDRFVAALHRRHVCARLAERAGMGLVVGGAFALLLLLLAILLNRPATAPVALSLATGAACGLAWGWISRPDILASVMEADRQLRLADLLSTAWSVRHRAADPWNQTVSHLAAAACRATPPSSVVWRRWGARAWGTVGLSAVLLLVLSAIIERPRTGLAAAPSDQSFDEPASIARPDRTPNGFEPAPPSQSRPAARQGHNPEDGQADSPAPATAGVKDASIQPRHEAGPHRLTQAANASASGLAESEATAQSLRLESPTSQPPTQRHHAPGEPTATGGGAATDRAQAAQEAPTGRGGSNPHSHPSGQTTDLAPAAAPTGNDPAADRPEYQPYQDLIRAYFDPR